mmetsp:Transcript_16112/g.27286  ORF Transcript_16112/g.27286 Transcript_16112/m.27286 type:complete len:205 (-) Transcript_16112:1214-1828(-)
MVRLVFIVVFPLWYTLQLPRQPHALHPLKPVVDSWRDQTGKTSTGWARPRDLWRDWVPVPWKPSLLRLPKKPSRSNSSMIPSEPMDHPATATSFTVYAPLSPNPDCSESTKVSYPPSSKSPQHKQHDSESFNSYHPNSATHHSRPPSPELLLVEFQSCCSKESMLSSHECKVWRHPSIAVPFIVSRNFYGTRVSWDFIKEFGLV